MNCSPGLAPASPAIRCASGARGRRRTRSSAQDGYQCPYVSVNPMFTGALTLIEGDYAAGRASMFRKTLSRNVRERSIVLDQRCGSVAEPRGFCTAHRRSRLTAAHPERLMNVCNDWRATRSRSARAYPMKLALSHRRNIRVGCNEAVSWSAASRHSSRETSTRESAFVLSRRASQMNGMESA